MELPLSKQRLHQLLARYEDGVTMEMVGGIDTGVYFSFKGKASAAINPAERVGGRILRPSGFCSEAIMPTREELFGRGGSAYGQELFFARCDARQKKFERWMRDFYQQKDGNEG
ncbi:hypothetical protein OIU34_20995 [Pararhizobium sp. BT-229]|uniref:hypothetical protein n=1 Tax=Pararhizobium sp. BT-229 TaxID=2986923 RepID=UPI0021F76636|nr:hypothetical protein [Pararhizobium sp. BT-229]MCV9964368.1 hypothetical protein [Pararhizobium sp. BT-229]